MKLRQSSKQGYNCYQVILNGKVIGEKKIKEHRLDVLQIKENSIKKDHYSYTKPVVMASVFLLPYECYKIVWHRVAPKREPKDYTKNNVFLKFIGFAKLHDAFGQPCNDG